MLVIPNLTLAQLNDADQPTFTTLLDGIYEHSSWIAEATWAQRPFQSLAHLKYALVQAVRDASQAQQLELICAHPELAGKAALAGQLTAESRNEQNQAGLAHCSPEELARLKELNAQYRAKFGWPFILAVRGPRGKGLSRTQIIATLERRLQAQPDAERAECLRHIHRIAEIRLNDKFGMLPTDGNQILDWAEALAAHTEGKGSNGVDERPPLTLTYLTPAHQSAATQLQIWMRVCGFDEVKLDAVGNVVGVYHGSEPTAARLLTGSHYDTVRNGGRYDGRLGILVPMMCVQSLFRAGRRLRHGIEVVAFAEEEGQRFPATFLGSSALVGDFQPDWLNLVDADGITLRRAMREAGLSAKPEDIAALKRDPARYLGFVEVHIEQGPVLNARDLPLGIVTGINGSTRFTGEAVGLACHAGTTPMPMRQDAALAVAEIALYTERRALQDQDSPDGPSVGTVGVMQVPQGSVNVVPGRCQFTLDLRAPTNGQRDALVEDVDAFVYAVSRRRGVDIQLIQNLQAAAAPCHPAWRARWEAAVTSLGLPVFHLPSGAGHDAMELHQVMPQAMLFVRGGHDGISHSPLETITNDDAQLCVDAFMHLLEAL